MLFQSTPWMQIHMIWLLIMLPLIQGSPITSQLPTQPATTTPSSSATSSFPIASPSHKPVLTATATAASRTHSSVSVVTAAPLVHGTGGLLRGTGGLISGNFTRPYNSVNMKFVQTTYWSCVQWPTTMHCGWHEPILDASNGAGSLGRGQEGAQRALGAGLLAGLVGFFLAAA